MWSSHVKSWSRLQWPCTLFNNHISLRAVYCENRIGHVDKLLELESLVFNLNATELSVYITVL